MELGIFARTYKRDRLNDILDAVVVDGFTDVQFNMACAGLESMPAKIEDHEVEKIREGVRKRGLRMCAISATFNMIHPQLKERERGVRRFTILAERARAMGADLLTLCTGTRDPTSMWKYHPDNTTPQAWADLTETLLKCIAIAEEHDLRLGIEPEIHNVIDGPQKARRLLDEMQCARLVIVMDPANIFRFQDLSQMDTILKYSFEQLEPFIALAHCKDVSDEDPPNYGAAGTGVLNYRLYIELLRQMDYQGPLVFHSLSEKQIPTSVEYVKAFLDNNI
jgi:sugar phosphate isomerase/epimerase